MEVLKVISNTFLLQDYFNFSTVYSTTIIGTDMLLLKVFLLAATIQYDFILSSQNSFSIKNSNVESKLDKALINEELILNNYAPASVTVVEKNISGRDFHVVVERTFFGKLYHFVLDGTLEVTKGAHKCKINETAYRAFFDFSKSGPDITEDIAAFSVDMCAKNINAETVTVISSNTLFYRGKKFNVLVEPVAKSVLNDQVNAFFSAIKLSISQL